MYGELDYKEGWVLKDWCFWIVLLEKILESPLDCSDFKPINPKRDQSWILFGRTDAEAETPILWPPDGRSWLIGKDPDAGNDWRWEVKGMTEDGWMASPLRWTWVWVGFESWWWTGKPGVLQFMGSQSRTRLSDSTELLSFREKQHFKTIVGPPAMFITTEVVTVSGAFGGQS